MPSTTPLRDRRMLDVNAFLGGQLLETAGFAAVGASVLDPFFNAPTVTGGVTYNQAAGSLNIVSSTTANAEFLARSVNWYYEAIRLRYSLIASQRIANNNLAIMLADRVGEGLTFNCVSATQVNVVIPAHGWTSQMVGQFVNIGGIVGAAGVPGRYAVASIVDANTVQFTVAGWPASGTGTCSVFGRSYIRNLVTGTVATNINFDGQRNGWASGDTVATVNTTASPGAVYMTETTGRELFFSDSLRASTTAPAFTTRASRYENIPDDTVSLFVWVWSYNGATAPASATTWTMAHLSVEMYGTTPVQMSTRASGQQNASPVAVASGTITTVSTVSNLAAIAAGANAIGDVGVQYRASATGAASRTHLVAAATTNATVVKAAAGRLLGWSVANTTAAWLYIKLHNQATAPTAGTGVVQTIAIPPNGLSQLMIEGGIGFATGIAYTTVTGSADADTTAVTAGAIVGDLFFA